MKINAKNDILIPEVKRQIDAGYQVTLRAKGRSMSPYIRDGIDLLLLDAPTVPAIGQILLVLTDDGKYVAHRVKAVDGTKITLQGDGNIHGIETADTANIIAQVTHIVRGGRRIDCTTAAEIRKARLMHIPYSAWVRTKALVARILGKEITSKIKQIIRKPKK